MTDGLIAYKYPDGTLQYPGHPLDKDGDKPVEEIDLSDYTATIVTWTTSTRSPPGVREPNPIAIVEFTVDGETVRAIGQVTTESISIGDEVRPIYSEQLRDPSEGIKVASGQEWDGYQFEPM